MRKLALWIATVLLSSGAQSAVAQSISQAQGNSNIQGNPIGQSFTATVTGIVTQIAVRPRANISNVSLRLYNSGVPSGPGDYTQVVSLTALSGNDAGFQTITLNTPLPVTAGQQYSFNFLVADLAYQNANVYGGGSLWVTGSSFAQDLAFQVYEQPTPAPVPTLSEWAMILLGVMLAAMAAVYVQRKRQEV
jgi:hypothetical protein